MAVVAAAVSSILLISAPIWRQWSYEPPYGQYLHALPALGIGIYFALSKELPSGLKHLLYTLVFGSVIYTLSASMAGISLTYFVGLVAALLLLREKSIVPNKPIIFEVSKTSFGIFLIHPLIIFLIRYAGITGITLPILCFAISAISIHIALKIIPKPLTRHML